MIDTGVYVSALISGIKICRGHQRGDRPTLQALIGGQVTAITSPMLIDELRRVYPGSVSAAGSRWKSVTNSGALQAIADTRPDADISAVDLVCRIPDRYLVALTGHVGAHTTAVAIGSSRNEAFVRDGAYCWAALSMPRTRQVGDRFRHDDEPEDAMRQAAAEVTNRC